MDILLQNTYFQVAEIGDILLQNTYFLVEDIGNILIQNTYFIVAYFWDVLLQNTYFLVAYFWDILLQNTYFLVADIGDICVLLRSWWDESMVVFVWLDVAPEFVEDILELLWLLMFRRPGCWGPACCRVPGAREPSCGARDPENIRDRFRSGDILPE